MPGKKKAPAKKTASKTAADTNTNTNDDGDKPKKDRKPPKPRETRTVENVFVVSCLVDVSNPDEDPKLEREIVDVFFDKSSALFVCDEERKRVKSDGLIAVESVDVEEQSAIVITSKAPGGGRGKKAETKTEVFLLDRDAKQPLEPESSEAATQARARREALSKLTPLERAALGFNADEPAEDPFE